MSTETITKPFTYDESAARQDYDDNGWFIASNGVADTLMQTLTDQVATMLGDDATELGEWRYPDKKSQFLLDLPDEQLREICDAVANSTGLDPATTVISERHLKVYSATAPAMPPAHKDRSASAVTVGIGIDIPADSRLVLWPTVDDTYNPYPTAAEWRQTRHDHELPERITDGIAPIEIDMRRGDVVMFRGARIYHERALPANTAVLYLKFNDFGLDPLGEDPSTVAAEQRTADVLAAGINDDTSIKCSARLVGIRTDELFPELATVTYARTIEDERAVRLEDDEAAILRDLRSGASTVDAVGASTELAERLARLGLVTLD